MASLVTVNYCRMDGESLGEGLLNLDHVCMITRNDEDTLTVVHFSVRRNRDESSVLLRQRERRRDLRPGG